MEEEKKIEIEERDLSPGFFSDYGMGNGSLIIEEPETGRRYRYRANGKKEYVS